MGFDQAVDLGGGGLAESIADYGVFDHDLQSCAYRVHFAIHLVISLYIFYYSGI